MKSDVFAALAQKTQNRNAAADSMAGLFDDSMNVRTAILPMDQLKEKANHPFQVKDDEKLAALAENIREDGLHQPIIVRPMADGFYEILAGHRRTMACRKIGRTKIEAIIVEADDERANRIMIATNFQQRDSHLPSEIAKSYKIRYDDLKKHAGDAEDKIDKRMEAEFSTSKSKVYMYLRVNRLCEALTTALDERRLNLRIAVELSYLAETEQAAVYEMVYEKALFCLSLKKAGRLKQKSKQGGLTRDDIWEILSGDLTDEKSVLFFSSKEIARYQYKFHSTEDMKETILQFLENYVA